MATEGSLNQSMNNAQRHYSSLFFLPTFKKAVAIIAAVCVISGLSSTLFSANQGLANGLAVGGALFLFTMIVDVFLSKVVLRDPIFVLRRMVVLSLFGWIFWLLFIILGSVLGTVFGATWWVNLILLGFATLITLRTVTLICVSSASFTRRIVTILLQPFACILPFIGIWINQGVGLMHFLLFLAASPFIAVLFSYFFVNMLDDIGKKNYNVPSISIFKAFMLNWVAALNAPLEGYLEQMGEDADIEVSFLKFDSAKPKAALIVPLVHPGPFKNIGSSVLPSLLKEEYEKVYGCEACVPLGLLGHELDAASQAQNHKIIDSILAAAKSEASLDIGTQFVRVSEDFVTASCQIFGKTALLSFTLAPKTTEDLPQELGDLVRNEAGKLGLTAVVINAHNSLTENTQIEASLDTLKAVAVKCLQEAVLLEKISFEVGATTVCPVEYTLKDGMSTGGITAIVVKVGNQKTAYVVIDGNNMVSGLREKILEALNTAGFSEGEVFTTDTHAVSALVVGRRGYHPIGEAMEHETLVTYVTNAVLGAAKNLESCKAGYQHLIVPKIRVIGGGSLGVMSVLVDKTIQKAKRIVAPVFLVEGLLLVLLLAFL